MPYRILLHPGMKSQEMFYLSGFTSEQALENDGTNVVADGKVVDFPNQFMIEVVKIRPADITEVYRSVLKK